MDVMRKRPLMFACTGGTASSAFVNYHHGMDWLRLAQHVVTRRTALGWSQDHLAEVAGMAQPTVSAIEMAKADDGGATPRKGTLAKLERALGWRPGSATAILAGGEPLVDEQPAAPAPAAEPQFANAEMRQLVRELARRYEDPDTPQADRIVIEGTLRQLKRIIDEQRAARADVRDADRPHV